MGTNASQIKLLGGNDAERLYLEDLIFKDSAGCKVVVAKTNHPGVDMEHHVVRHKGRYALPLLFATSRPGLRVLDFPCGSGYGAEILKPAGAYYTGIDQDTPTVEYADKVYGDKMTRFKTGDLCKPKLPSRHFDLIGCIEGLEHIERKHQENLIPSLKLALKKGGTLIVSSPESNRGISGPNPNNPYHLWELTKDDFAGLLAKSFGSKNVELVTYKAIPSTSKEIITWFFGICHNN